MWAGMPTERHVLYALKFQITSELKAHVLRNERQRVPPDHSDTYAHNVSLRRDSFSVVDDQYGCSTNITAVVPADLVKTVRGRPIGAAFARIGCLLKPMLLFFLIQTRKRLVDHMPQTDLQARKAQSTGIIKYIQSSKLFVHQYI